MTIDNYLEQRFDALLQRLHTAYEAIGHSSGRPYLYFVYSPKADQEIRRWVRERMVDDHSLHYFHIDLLQLTIESLTEQEQRRGDLLNDPVKGAGAAQSVVRLWARRLSQTITNHLADGMREQQQPVVVLYGLAALHPLGNPTNLMEAVAEQEPRDPNTNKIVPVVLLVPGEHPPQTSRTYWFLGLENQQLSFYRGEEI